MIAIRWFLFATAIASTVWFWPHPWCLINAFVAGMLFCSMFPAEVAEATRRFSTNLFRGM